MLKKMIHNVRRFGFVTITGVLFFSCSAEKKAEEIFEVAAFEEVQFNVVHARELYEEILNKYPDTETAVKARKALERLDRE